MAQQERTMSPPFTGPSPMATSTGRQQNLSPIGQRPLGRASTFADVSSPLRHRRSSTFSDSTRQSIKSSTDDLLLPRATNQDVHSIHEPSHWQSLPLALALFPALGGLFFNNGSAIVTDLTLLVLAAIFLNWSVRLPWDWYVSAQSIRAEDAQSFANVYSSDTIVEEGSEEEEESAHPGSIDPDDKNTDQQSHGHSSLQVSAAAELRVHELLALAACFLFPAVGAWLLHHIRYQLSRPSEGLVSNYNLTIFILASELRPMSHLIKMVQARTLHLQRSVATNPEALSPASPKALNDLSTRLAELETHIADTTSNGSSSKSSSPDLITQIRKTFQPDLDALNRAVRRYEKRATLQTMQTESRLQDLEKRMGDAITLAAAAERSSQSNRQRRGSSVGFMMDWVATMAMLPIQIGWTVLTLPGKVIAGLVGRMEGYVGQKIKKEMRTAGRGDSRVSSGSDKRRAPGRGQKKAM